MAAKRCKYEDWDPQPVCTPGARIFMRTMAVILCVLALILITLSVGQNITWPLIPAGLAAFMGLICAVVL